jgi:hypothetical protein
VVSNLVSSSTLATIFSVCCLGAAPAVAETGLTVVPMVPGAFQPQGAGPSLIEGKSLDAAQVESLAGKPDGYDILDDWHLGRHAS